MPATKAITKGKTSLLPIRKIESFAVIIRAIHERGRVQQEALAEIERRGLWLSPEQRRAAELPPGYVIRRETDKPDAVWCLVALRFDGSEYIGARSSPSVSELVRHLRPGERAVIEA